MVLDLDDGKSFRFAALQSPAGMALLERGGRQRDDISSIILSTPGQAEFTSLYQKAADTVILVLEILRWPLESSFELFIVTLLPA